MSNNNGYKEKKTIASCYNHQRYTELSEATEVDCQCMNEVSREGMWGSGWMESHWSQVKAWINRLVYYSLFIYNGEGL